LTAFYTARFDGARRGADQKVKAETTNGRPAAGLAPAAERDHSFRNSPRKQYAAAFGTFVAVSLLNLSLEHWIGYQTVPLVYLVAVVLLALAVNRGPLLFGTALTAVGWNFLFAPPKYSLHIADVYDKAMLATYFVVALTIGHLTARARAQQAAELKAQLFAESERLGRTLLNSVSHELRTPIAAISSAADGLLESRTLDPGNRKLAVEIDSASVRLNRVVQGLLSAARIQSGQLRPRLNWCDPQDVVHAALEDTREIRAGHPIELEIADDLPLVKLDAELMKQALSNLLVNAAIYTPTETSIKVTARAEEKNLVMQVADRGPGLPPEHIESIFELFYRAPNAKPGGTGLGLAIVKGFIEAQGGRVQAANRAQGGAIFSIFLPTTEQPQLPEEKI
jgi:two-component system sensor histidine kinase KdpD